MKTKNKINISNDFASIVPNYISEKLNDAYKMENALKMGDFDTIKTLAHNLRGTGSSYGFPVLSDLGKVIENAAKMKDSKTIQVTLQETFAYINSLEISYN